MFAYHTVHNYYNYIWNIKVLGQIFTLLLKDNTSRQNKQTRNNNIKFNSLWNKRMLQNTGKCFFWFLFVFKNEDDCGGYTWRKQQWFTGKIYVQPWILVPAPHKEGLSECEPFPFHILPQKNGNHGHWQDQWRFQNLTERKNSTAYKTGWKLL